jgi:hypothetical protein
MRFFVFFNSLLYWSSADFSDLFRLKGRQWQTFFIIVSQKSVSFKYFRERGGSPAASLGCAPGLQQSIKKVIIRIGGLNFLRQLQIKTRLDWNLSSVGTVCNEAILSRGRSRKVCWNTKNDQRRNFKTFLVRQFVSKWLAFLLSGGGLWQ